MRVVFRLCDVCGVEMTSKMETLDCYDLCDKCYRAIQSKDVYACTAFTNSQELGEDLEKGYGGKRPQHREGEGTFRYALLKILDIIHFVRRSDDLKRNVTFGCKREPERHMDIFTVIHGIVETFIAR